MSSSSSMLKPSDRLGSSSSSPGLSKSVLNMKFMKSREPIVSTSSSSSLSKNEPQEKGLNHSQNMIIDDIQIDPSTSNSDVNNINNYYNSAIVISSKVQFIQETKDPLSLLPGRRSFQNCNAAVEKNYRARMDELNLDVSALLGGSRSVGLNAGSSVSDEEMIERYKHLVGLPRGPNQSRKPTTHQQQVSGSRNNQSGKHSGGSSNSEHNRGSINKKSHKNGSSNSNSNSLTGAEVLRKQQQNGGREDTASSKYPMKKMRK